MVSTEQNFTDLKSDLTARIVPFPDKPGLLFAGPPIALEDVRFQTTTLLSAVAHLAAILTVLLTVKSRPVERVAPEVWWIPTSQIVLPEEAKSPAPKPKPQEPLPSLPERQIVSPTQAAEAPPEKPTPFLSDRDSRTDHEQLRRGAEDVRPPQAFARATQPIEKPTAPPKRQSPAATPSAPTKLPAEPSKPTTLRLSPDDLIHALNQTKPNTGPATVNDESPADEVREERLRSAQPFNKNSFNFGVRSGSSDFLPNIPDGDITLLNAKADRFAVFVRRVALQVFSALRQQNWHSLSAAEISRLADFAVVEAVMTKDGKLAGVRITESSGSAPFDQVLQRSAEKGAWDQNPPPRRSSPGRKHPLRIQGAHLVPEDGTRREALAAVGNRTPLGARLRKNSVIRASA